MALDLSSRPNGLRVDLDAAVTQYVQWGWRVESRTESQAVVVKGRRPNHLLHLVLSLITLGFWIPVWICVAIFAGEKRKTLTAS